MSSQWSLVLYGGCSADLSLTPTVLFPQLCASHSANMESASGQTSESVILDLLGKPATNVVIQCGRHGISVVTNKKLDSHPNHFPIIFIAVSPNYERIKNRNGKS